jgi:hypothetical protein
MKKPLRFKPYSRRGVTKSPTAAEKPIVGGAYYDVPDTAGLLFRADPKRTYKVDILGLRLARDREET